MSELKNDPSMTGLPDSEVDLGQLFNMLWRGKFLIFIFVVFGVLTSLLFVFLVATPHYTTTATVVQETNQEPVVDFSAALGGGLASGLTGGADQSSINTEVEILRSRDILENLAIELELSGDPEFNELLRPEPAISPKRVINDLLGIAGMPLLEEPTLTKQQELDAVVQELRRALSISNIRQSYVFELTVEAEEPQKAARIANTLAESYIRDQIQKQRDANSEAIEFLTDQVGNLQTELERAETTVRDFNAATDLINAETLAALNRQVKELRDRVEDERVTAAELVDQVTDLKAAPEDFEQRAILADDRLLNRHLDDLLSGATIDPRQFDDRFEQIIRQAELEERRLRGQIEALEASIAEQEEAIRLQSKDILRLQQLEREAAASGLLYEFFLSRLKETSIQSGLQDAESRVLSRAIVPIEPSSPQVPILLALGLTLSGFLGASLVLVREFRNKTYRAAEILEQHLNIPVFGQIPRVSGRSAISTLKSLARNPNSVLSEAMRSLRTTILHTDQQSAESVIVVTSSVTGENKTALSMALAQTLANQKKKVLLIDADLNRRPIAKALGIKSQKGLQSVVLGTLEISEATSRNSALDVDVLVAEADRKSPTDIFSDKNIETLIDEMRIDYDHVILSAPPALLATDARLIGRLADVVLYVVKWDSTTRRQVGEGVRLLHSVGLNINGFVLSQINPKRQRQYGFGDTAVNYQSQYRS